MSKQLSEAWELRGHRLPNRICIPPMVIFGLSDETGMVTDGNVAHYTALARGGAGLIIQEATCVQPGGKLSPDQLGIWSDEHVPGLARIAEAVHAEGGTILMQIHHAGVVGVAEEVVCPSAYATRRKTGRAMTAAEVEEMIAAFVAAGVRAQRAGYDGVELHGCHRYLLSQFFNARVNRRTDVYADPIVVVRRIFDGIRAAVPEDFIIGIRLGAFEPTLADGIGHAQALAAMGMDFLDVSYGFVNESEPFKPEGFPFVDVVYAAGEIKKAVDIPVFAVNSICTAAEAQGVLDLTDVDMVDIARSALIDPAWPRHALAGEPAGKCLHCPGGCQWMKGQREKCPGLQLFARQNA